MTATDELDTYRVYAIRYARKTQRQRYENFINADPHDGEMPLDYYIWALIGSDAGSHPRRVFVVDTGFDHAEAGRRGRELMRLPREGLALLDIDSQHVEDVIITHLHYDHAGTLDDFPRARFHIQDLEMAYATGRHMCHLPLRYAYTADHVKNLIDRLYAGRVVFHDGDAVLAPGLSVHHIGGHTMGLQCVRVHTARGWLVLASDASHFYENMETVAPFPIVYNVGDMIQGYAKMRALAASERHIIPGHDPLVLERYPPPAPALAGTVAQLDLQPLS